MKSIQAKLICYVSLVIIFVLVAGSISIYRSVKTSLYNEIDTNLISILSLELLEIEISGSTIEHEWLFDLESDAQRRLKDYIQVWNFKTGETLRSPALKEADLPRVEADQKGLRFWNVTLDNGLHLRVVGTCFIPEVNDEVAATVRPEDFLFAMSIAHSTENADNTLSGLLQTLALGLFIAVLLSITVVSFVIHKSLQPIMELEEQVDRVDVNNPEYSFILPKTFPHELKGLVDRYSELFAKIEAARNRERHFASNAAHELRTPLAGIEAILEQAISKKRNEEEYESRIAEALEISKQMSDMINRLMHYTRLQSGAEEVQLSKGTLRNLIEKRLLQNADLVDQKGLWIDCKLPAGDSVIKSDFLLLDMLIGNLINNAVVHSVPHSEVTILVEETGESLTVLISNAVRGLSNEGLEQIFEPFYRHDTSRTGNGAHSGIGLALCHDIGVLLHLKLDAFIPVKGRFCIRVTIPKFGFEQT